MLESTPPLCIRNVAIYGPGLHKIVCMPESYCWEDWFDFIYTESPTAGWKCARSSDSGILFIMGDLSVHYGMIRYKEHFMNAYARSSAGRRQPHVSGSFFVYRFEFLVTVAAQRDV